MDKQRLQLLCDQSLFIIPESIKFVHEACWHGKSSFLSCGVMHCSTGCSVSWHTFTNKPICLSPSHRYRFKWKWRHGWEDWVGRLVLVETFWIQVIMIVTQIKCLNFVSPVWSHHHHFWLWNFCGIPTITKLLPDLPLPLPRWWICSHVKMKDSKLWKNKGIKRVSSSQVQK